MILRLLVVPVALSFAAVGCSDGAASPASVPSAPGGNGGNGGVSGGSGQGGTVAGAAGSTDAGGSGAGGSAAGSAGGGPGGGQSGGSAGAAGQAGTTGTRVRVLAGNLSTGSQQSWTGGEGLRIVAGLHPDVALLQELNYGQNSDAELTAFAEAALGPGAHAHREPGAAIPNAVLSTYPFVDVGVWVDPEVQNRGFAWARIDVPGDADLFAVSVHLLTSSPTQRALEATSLVAQLQSAVPPGAMIVVGGDFNTAFRTEACITEFSMLFATAPPYPADASGNGNTSANRSKPHDWVLASPLLFAREIPVAIGGASFAAGLVFDSRVYVPLDDVAPVLVTDSGANGMQHMAVVRDFSL